MIRVLALAAGVAALIWFLDQTPPSRCLIVGDHEYYNHRCIPYCPPRPSECG